MISGRNKLTFVDARSGNSKNIVRKRPGLLSLNSTFSCAAVGLAVWLTPGLQGQLDTVVEAGSEHLVSEISVCFHCFDFLLFVLHHRWYWLET